MEYYPPHSKSSEESKVELSSGIFEYVSGESNGIVIKKSKIIVH